MDKTCWIILCAYYIDKYMNIGKTRAFELSELLYDGLGDSYTPRQASMHELNASFHYEYYR